MKVYVPLRSLLVSTSLALTVGLASAQQGGSRFDIPFPFSVGKVTMPAGTYLIQKASGPGLGDIGTLKISGLDQRLKAMFFTNAVERAHASQQPELVFRCYGKDCFLSQVWAPTEDSGRETIVGNKEHLLAKQSPVRTVELVAAQHEPKK